MPLPTMQPSRRAFLTAGRGLGSPWGRFFQRLSLVAHGRLDDRTAGRDDAGLACLRPARPEDVLHAQSLCAECGVTLALDGAPAAPATGPRLLLDPARLDAIVRQDDGAWRVEPGVTIDTLRQALPGACPGASPAQTVAAWMADPARHGWPVAGTAGSGLHALQLLLPDGGTEAFGPFGAATRRQALSARASGLVASLFSAGMVPGVAAWRERAAWPARYRLDALWCPEPNLSHLLLGGVGTLGWAVYLVFAPSTPAGPASPGSVDVVPDPEARRLEQRLRAQFDPGALWTDLPFPTVAPSAGSSR